MSFPQKQTFGLVSRLLKHLPFVKNVIATFANSEQF